MSFFGAILAFFQEFIESLFSSSSPEYKKKSQMRQIALQLKGVEPPIFRPDGVLLPAFPATLYQIYQFLQPVRDTLGATIGSPDKRISERYYDFLIELALGEEQRASRKAFTFTERSAALIAQNTPVERIIEEQGKQFSQFIKSLDNPTMHQASVLLDKLDGLADFCQFDFNNFFAYFDPAFKTHSGQDSTVEAPSFHPVEVVEVIPVLLDLYYLLSNLSLSQSVIDIVSLLEARKNNIALSAEGKSRTNRVFQAIIFLLQKRLGKESILAIIRMTKEDPDFKPDQPQHKNDHLQQYKIRITDFFHSDSRKLVQDQQDNEIRRMIMATFGSVQLETIQGYNDETNQLLQELTPFSLEWIKPIQIIKTFAVHYFDPHFRQILRSVIVEGFFNNRSIQTALSSAYYYCESVSAKIGEFELLFADNQPCSLKIMTGYLTELEKGMDFEKPLRKIVENMNNHARAFIQQAVTQYTEVFNFSGIIMEDSKKSMPEYITNIRNLTSSTKNSESFSWLEKETGVFRNFLEIMKKYAIVGTLSVSSKLTDQTES